MALCASASAGLPVRPATVKFKGGHHCDDDYDYDYDYGYVYGYDYDYDYDYDDYYDYDYDYNYNNFIILDTERAGSANCGRIVFALAPDCTGYERWRTAY